MKMTVKGWWMATVMAATCWLPVPAAFAQSGDVQPAVVVTIGPADELLKDISYVTKAVGQPQAGGLVQVLAGQYLAPLDTKRSWGAYVALDQGEPQVVSYLPVKDFDGLVGVFAEQMGEPDVDGEMRIFTAPDGSDVYMTQSGDWAYVSNTEAALGNLPQDPGAWYEGYESYNVAVRVIGTNVPDEMKQFAMGAMREGFEGMLAQLPPDQAELQRATNEAQLEQMEAMIQDLDQMVIGMAIDAAAKEIQLDFQVTGIPGSDLAETMSIQSGVESEFLGFLVKGAAMNMNFAAKVAEADAARTSEMLDQIAEQGLAEMENDDSMNPMELEVATNLVNALIGSLKTTIESGRMDGGAAVVLDKDTTALVAGFHALETQKIEDAVKEVVELAKTDAPPGVEFNLDKKKEGDVNWHEIVIPVPDGNEEATKMFGETLTVWLGVAPEAIYLSAGRNGETILNQAIEGSESAQATENRGAEMNLNLGSIMEFAASVQDDPQLDSMASAMKGKDATMSIYSDMIDNGSRTRLTIREGFLSAMGEIVNQAMAAAGGAQF